jgi:hypothetical protein
MTIQGTANYQVTSWDESPYAEGEDGRKLTKASVRYAITGDIEGESASESLMCYAPDGTATYVGLDRVVGRIGDRSGSFVLQVSGTYDGTAARATLSVVPGSGTGALAGLRGTSSMVATHQNVPVTFEFGLD